MCNALSDSSYVNDFFHRGVPGDEEDGGEESQKFVLKEADSFSHLKVKSEGQGRKNQEQGSGNQNQNQNQNQKGRNQGHIFGLSDSFRNQFMFNRSSFYVL